jgi:Bacteriophage lambda head decoration protein D
MALDKIHAGFENEGTSIPLDDLIASGGNIIGRKYTLITGQNVVRGTVLGVITASGKLNTSLSAAVDGSQTPFGIAAHDVDATAADKDIEVYTRGNFNEHKLVLGAAHTIASIREGLRGKGIYLETPIQNP